MIVAAPNVVTRAEVEDFLFREAALLDEWKLNEWQELLTDEKRGSAVGGARNRRSRCNPFANPISAAVPYDTLKKVAW